MFKFVVAVAGLLAFSVSARAEISKTQLDQLAVQFFMTASSPISKMSQNSTPVVPLHCEQQTKGASCVEESCALIGSYNCDDISEIEKVGNMCRGNWDGRCIATVCNQIGAYNCDDFSEVEKAAVICRPHHDGECIKKVCAQIGNWNCDDFSEVQKVANTCKNVDSSCVEAICKKIGAYNCDDLSEIERVANSCRGN